MAAVPESLLQRRRPAAALHLIAGAAALASAFSAAAGAQTIEDSQYCSDDASNIILYLDTTTPYDASDQATLVSGIGHIFEGLEDGARLSIRTIEDTFANSERLLDMCVPYCESGGFLADLFSQCTAGVVINDRKRLREAIRRTISQRVRGSTELPHSEIIRTLASSAREEYRAQQSNTIFIFSDMIENSTYLSGRQFFSTATKALLNRLKKDNLVPDLAGATVRVFGFGRNGVASDRKALPQEAIGKLQSFWTAYFEAGGATLSLEQNLTTAE